MNKVIVRAPVRADLAGGTLDLWPLYLFHPGARTVNVAISYFAETELSTTGNGAFEIHLTDQQYRHSYESLQQMAADPKVALLYRALEHFRLTGVRIVTRTDAPRGSGLGGSSALAVTLVRALSDMAGEPVEGEELIALVRDLETRVLGVPAGIQDYYPPVYGGLGSIHLSPGRPARHPLHTPIAELGRHMLMHYSGIAHFSGTNNWELYKRQIEGKKKVQKGLGRIAEISQEMERALESGNFAAAGGALRSEWEARKALIDGISTPEIDSAIDVATAAGAWGAKVCGAGGGGCIVLLCPPDRREAIARALTTVPGRTLDAAPIAHGMTIERESQATGMRPRIATRRGGESVEQLWVAGGAGDYRPFVLAEGIVTHSEARSGIRRSAVRSYLVPIETSDGRVLWHEAVAVDPDDLDIRAVPEPERRLDVEITPEALVQSAALSQEGFRSFLEQTERLQIFHNPSFGMYSEPPETRGSFLERCQEEARRQIELAQERLESTFRRRIDQLRERSEREQREIERKDEGVAHEANEVNVAWGQTLYNITSGRRPAPADPAASIREGDYVENIAQIQKSWDRELQAIRDELTSKAHEIEEISVTAGEKNIEVTRYLILWASQLPQLARVRP